MPLPPSPGPVGAGTAPGQPPFGPTGGAVSPTPNRGAQANGLVMVKMAVGFMEKALPLLGSGSPVGQDLLESIKKLSKHTPPGSGAPGVETTGMKQALLEQQQNRPLQQVLGAMGQQQQQQVMPPEGVGAPPG